MDKTVEPYLNDIKKYISRIQKSIKLTSAVEFYNDIDLQDMTLRRLHVIGEVVKRIPDNYKQKFYY